jgi:hypothetical protein
MKAGSVVDAERQGLIAPVVPTLQERKLRSRIRFHEVSVATLRQFLYLFMASFVIVTSYAQRRPENPRGTSPVSPVTLVSVEKVLLGNNRPAYLVSFSYDFDQVANIYIKGFGIVPSSGTYQYVSNERELQFCDPTTRAVLERVSLEETAVVAAKPPLIDIPNDNQFSQGSLPYIWDSPSSLQERANAVLKKYFLLLPHENNSYTYLATTYTPLPLNKRLADSGILAQIALLISFPSDPATKKYSFHVRYAAKEGRPLSDDLRSTNNAEILRLANSFVDNIVTEMKAGGGRP